MDRKVLKDPAVAGYVSERFVPVRVDVIAAEDAAIRQRCRIGQEVPLCVLLGPDGEELDRLRGMVSRDDFLVFLRDAVDGNHFAALERRAAKGEDGYDFLVAYGRRLYDRHARGATGILQRVVELDPRTERASTIDARYWLARLGFERGDAPVEVLAEFARAFPRSPRAIEAHRVLALIHGGRGDAERAIASYEFLRSHDALETPWQKHAYARLLARNGGDAELALALAAEALDAVPDEPGWLDTKAECLSRLGRHDEAIAAESRAIEKATTLADRREFERALYEMKKRRAEADSGE